MSVHVIGLNQALQKSLIFDDLEFGEVNRSKSVDYAVGGKGANFARAAKTWGADIKLFQFAGGDTGKTICDILDSEEISHDTVFVDTPTRTCTTCLCEKTGSMTELIEPSGQITEEQSQQLLKHIINSIANADGISLCGTYPPGVGDHFYAEIAKQAKSKPFPVMLDAWQDIEETLQTGGIDILKINRKELQAITSQQELDAGIDLCFEKYGISVLAITDGPEQAFLAKKDGSKWIFHIPKLGQVKNPLGAGDTVAAIMFSEYVAGKTAEEAFATGLAAGSASCLNLKVADYSKDKALELKQQLVYEKI